MTDRIDSTNTYLCQADHSGYGPVYATLKTEAGEQEIYQLLQQKASSVQVDNACTERKERKALPDACWLP
jgi:hypothetical protein